MIKFLYPLLLLLLALALLFSFDSAEKGSLSPYRDSDSQLLIPQRNMAIAAIDLRASGLFPLNRAGIRRMESLREAFHDLEGVTRVDSLLSAYTIEADEDEIEIKPFIPPEGRGDASFFGSLTSSVARHRELLPYISRDGKYLLYYVYFGYNVKPAAINNGLQELRDRFPGIAMDFTGKAPVIAGTEKLLAQDILLFIPLLLLLVSLVFFMFRNFKAAATSWLVLILASGTAYTVVRYSGIPNSPILLLVPVFCLGLLSDYLIHYFYHLFYAPEHGSRLSVRRRLLFPLSLTAASTLTGFFSLFFLQGSGHKLLGGLISGAVLFTYGAVFLWLPHLRYGKPAGSILPHFHTLQIRFFRHIFKIRRFIYALLLGAMAVSLALLPRLKVEPYPIQQLPAESTFQKAETVINDHFFGTAPFFIEIDTGETNGALSTETLRILDGFHKNLEADDAIGYAQSILTVLKELSWYFEGDRDALLKDSLLGSFAAEQYLLYYSSSVDPLEYESLINSSYRIFSIKGLLYYGGTETLAHYQGLVQQLQNRAPEGWTVTSYGMMTELMGEEESLKRNWMFSFLFGLVLIFLMVLLYYRRLKTALLTLLPGLISMFLAFGFIAAAGIRIDVFSIIFVAVIMGLVIDYSIHTLTAIETLPAGTSPSEGFSFIIRYSGKPIFLSFLTSLISFSVLFLSSFQGARTLGMLLTISLLIAFFLSLYLLPILFLSRREKLKTEQKEPV